MQGFTTIAHQARFDGISQSDLCWVTIDLNPTRLIRFRHVLDVGKRAAHDQYGVCIFHGFLGRAGAEESDRAGRIRAIVWHYGFAQQSFNDGCTQ